MDTKMFLGERRRRTASGILGHCEQSQWWAELDRNEQRALRDKVLSDLASYHDIVLDVVKALEADTSGVTNQRVLQLLEQIHGTVTHPERALTG